MRSLCYLERSEFFDSEVLVIAAIIIFCIGYCISMTATSILYHRGLAHNALTLPTWLVNLIGKFAMPIIGIDPKTWICMHRLHHVHSDTKEDPHSPCNDGPIKIFFTQHRSFEKVCIGLIKGRKKYTQIVDDIPFDIHWLTRKGLWWLPFAGHAVIAVGLGLIFSNIWLSVGYFGGIAGHPVQGYLVNSFGHWIGYRNFDSNDNSKNNTLVAWGVFGEGYQNNHHEYPSSPKFSVRWFEFDPGYIVVNILAFFHILKINKEFIPKYSEQLKRQEAN